MKKINSVQFTILVILFCVIIFLLKPLIFSKENISQQKKYASLLLQKELYSHAVEEYKKLISSPKISNKERANISYIIGNIYLEKLHSYSDALAFYLKVKILDPKTKLQPQLNQKIVECLDRMGRHYEAQKELDKITLLKKPKEISSKPVVAKIGNREISFEELENKIKNLPPHLQSIYKDKHKQLEFLKSYIATELLYNAAKRRNYHNDPKIIEFIEEFKRSLMVQKFIEDETKNKINVTDTEIKLYYEAHKKEFIEKKDNKERLKELNEVKDQIIEILKNEKKEQLQQQLLNQLFSAEKVVVYEDKFFK